MRSRSERPRADDAEAIAQLLYENYHLSYVHADFYRPRFLIAGLASGELLSAVAVHDGRVVGHHALMPRPGIPSAETGAAVVHSAYRGLGLFGRLFEHTLGAAVEAGLRLGVRRCRHHPSLQPARGGLARLPRDGAPARHGPGADDDARLRERRASAANGHAALVPSPRRASTPGRAAARLSGAARTYLRECRAVDRARRRAGSGRRRCGHGRPRRAALTWLPAAATVGRSRAPRP